MSPTTVAKRDRPLAAVYRGSVACQGCAESVYRLLENSPPNFQVKYLGPSESQDVTAAALQGVSLFAWPGGGDNVDSDYRKVSNYTTAIQNFVQNGGLYAGFCFGAFLGRGPGRNSAFFGLLPENNYVTSERTATGAQVRSSADTIAQVDWTFRTGSKQGLTEANRWMYFQDSGRVVLDAATQATATILARYSYTKNIAAAILPYGNGRVGMIGTHPEAEQSWYSGYRITNPDGIQFDLGYDFVQSLYTVQSALNTTNSAGNITTNGTTTNGPSTTARAAAEGVMAPVGMGQLGSVVLLAVWGLSLFR